MKLIWHADRLQELDWLRDIFGNHIDGEATDLDLTCFDDDSIHVISSNRSPLPTYTDYFRECRAQCKHIVLVHLSDEWFSGGYEVYRYFDLVIRQNRTYLAEGNGILTIPLGYPQGTHIGGPVLSAVERRYAWSFTGEIKASRIAMASAFHGFEPQFLTRTDSISDAAGKRLSKAEFDAVLGNTVFAPCPMGNANLETWRLYESLEFGCIPLVEHRLTLDYFSDLFGPNPIPKFRNWSEARQYAERAFGDKQYLLRKQTELRDWWTAYKAKVRSQVRAAVTGPSQTMELQFYVAKIRNRYPMAHEPLRLMELVRHQSAASLRRRLARPSGPLRRILYESLRIGGYSLGK
jgi:hypothetical protein